MNEAGESQLEETKEEVAFLHQARQDRGITASTEHFLGTRHYSKGCTHSCLLNPRHNSCEEYNCYISISQMRKVRECKIE